MDETMVFSATDRLSDCHFEEILRLIDKIPELTTKEALASFEAERAYERYVLILDLYQEQPHLLDPNLDAILTPLLRLARSPKCPSETLKLAFSFLMHLTKVRGYKTMLRHLPHEVTDLEPTLCLLEAQNPTDHSTHALRYMLLLWLVIICKIPFDLKRFDSDRKSQESATINRLISVSKQYMFSSTSDTSGEMAALVLANLITRPDVKEKFLVAEINAQFEKLNSLNIRHMVQERQCITISILLSQIFKHGKRDDLLPLAPFCLSEILRSSLPQSSQAVLRKQAVKLVQRIGLLFLKPRVASWRYHRGNRSITENLKPALNTDEETKDPGSQNAVPMEQSENEDAVYQYQEQLGQVIEFLLKHLRDRETVVRWSAAKGLGRVTSRLPRDMADEVVSSIMELLTIRESDAAWHGGCLSLAELGRRGFLLPTRLPEVVPVVLKALNYEEQQGRFSVGAHVRDAACYLCWSFARAYDPVELQPYVTELASALLAMTIFDREVNCRRAASAAFQENVGRQGSFPHGIEILTVADYFAVGQRNHCYKELSVFIASFPEYTETMIRHLLDLKVGHWDVEIRLLAAEALGCLTKVAPDLFEERVIAELVNNCVGIDLFLRQGSVFAVAEICQALLGVEKSINPEICRQVINIPKAIESKQFLKGMGQDIIRSALNKFMEQLALVHFPNEDTETLNSWHRILEENLCYSDDAVRQGAAVALAPFCRYYKNRPEELNAVIKKFVEKLKSKKAEIDRIGAALALGNLPKFVLEDKKTLEMVIHGLVVAGTSKTEVDKCWALARKESVSALGLVLETTRDFFEDVDLNLRVFGCYMEALSDYTTDSRGDIGRIVRESGLVALKDLLELAGSGPKTKIFTERHVLEAICAMIRQCCEKIDSTRKIAAEGLTELLHCPKNKLIESIPSLKLLQTVFPAPRGTAGKEDYIKWMSGAEAFPRLAPLLACPEYHTAALTGFLVSAGGMTESTMKTASDSLLGYVGEIKESGDVGKMDMFLESFTRIAEKQTKDQRLIAPLLVVLDQILASDYLDMYNGRADDCQYLKRLLDVTIEATAKKKNVARVLSGLSVFCSMLQFESTSHLWQRAMKQTLVALTHPYLKVRRGAASKLYEAMLTFGCLDNHTEIVMSYLAETDWDKDPSQLKEIQLEIADRMGISIQD